MYFLKMENIHKFYGSVHALKGVNFEVAMNEIVGLVGDNGAGKSTLVGIIAGSIPKTSGKIFVKGKEVEIPSVKAARDLGIEMVYQDQAVVETMSVAKNIFLGRELLKPGLLKLLDMKTMRKEAERITKSLGLNIASPDQEIRFCSGGERQGVAISRAMYFKAELVILDEPTAALSIAGVQKVLEFIRQLKASGTSVIFISHNLYHVYPLADRIVVFSKGEKVADMRKGETSIEELEHIQISGKRISS
ncbi:sugar ABC transporter ATP-binding protein [Candidatus Aerophobetes bacterium]|uniref:Sugar ABC transporter ATP-binding protein n=1 Tax=Aerophobetes bacterium TaxID=2030807 RepID=A0A497E4I5_UNCAE|nr:MAG: sugar ABC transporter ATP-binding protein [Candidatus Aerophobetes bacterium]